LIIFALQIVGGIGRKLKKFIKEAVYTNCKKLPLFPFSFLPTPS